MTACGLKVAVLSAVGGILLWGGTVAKADAITVTLVSDGPNSGFTPGYTEWNYSITTDAATHLVAGDSFTISGFGGLFDAFEPANFTATDNQSLGFVTFTYTGPTTGTGVSISGFQVNTDPGDSYSIPGSFTASGTNGSGTTISDTDSVLVGATPEPSTLSLMGLGLVALGLVRRRLVTPGVVAAS